MSDDRIKQWLLDAGVTRLRPTGEGNYISTCPFHKDKHPSFSMRSDNGLFVCYAQGCGASGNLVNFLMSALEWKYQKAIDAVERIGIPSLNDPAVSYLPPYAERKTHEDVEEYSMKEGHLGLYDFCPAYMVRRGFDKNVLRKWDIGYDYGVQRVTFPVRDASGKLVGISKRATLDGQLPKYLHLGFRRGHFLYGMQYVKYGVTAAVLVEGQADVLAWSQLYPDYPICPLATMGSRVTKKQVDWIAKHCSEVFLAFDNDTDGQATTERVGDALIGRIPRGRLYVYDTWPEGVKDIGDLIACTRLVQKHFVNRWQNYDRARLVL